MVFHSHANPRMAEACNLVKLVLRERAREMDKAMSGPQFSMDGAPRQAGTCAKDG
ncbi:MAG: hypothetical protein ACE5QF_03340 [Thermoplasmata archaeon]